MDLNQKLTEPTFEVNTPPQKFIPQQSNPQQSNPQPKSRNRLFLYLGIGLAVVIILGGGYFAWDRGYISIPFLTPDIDEVIAAIFTELGEVEQARYEVSLAVKAEDREDGIEPINLNINTNTDISESCVEGEDCLPPIDYLDSMWGGVLPTDVDLYLMLEGIYKKGTAEISENEFGLSGHYSSMGTTYALDARLKKLEDDVYFRIDKFPLNFFFDMSAYIGKWVFLGDNEVYRYYIDFLEEETDETRQIQEQIFEVITIASDTNLIKLERTGGKEIVSGYNTQKINLVLDHTKLKDWYKQTTDILAEKFDDKAIYEYDEEVYENFDDPYFLNIFKYIQENTVINFWLDVNTGVPRKMEMIIKFVPPEDMARYDGKQLSLNLTMELKNINENVTIERPTDVVTWDEIEREMEGINEDEQKIKKQGDRVSSLRSVLSNYNRIFEQYPSSWLDLFDTTEQEIDQAVEAAADNIKYGQKSIERWGESIMEELERVNTKDYFTENDYPYELVDEGYKFTYQMPLEKVQEKNMDKYYFSRYADGLNTANQKYKSVEYQGQKDTDTDGDGLTDYQENYIYKTDPTKKDTDGDGFDDKTEIENGYNPNGDGLAPAYGSSGNQKSRDAKRVSDIRTLQSALELYYNNQTKPSYPADGIAGAPGTTGIGALISSVSSSLMIYIAPTPPETGCSSTQNSYTYASFSDAAHQVSCDQQPCAYYTLSYCLGGETGGIEKGSHTACERGVNCKPEDNVNSNLNQNYNYNYNSNVNTNLNTNQNLNTNTSGSVSLGDCVEGKHYNYRKDNLSLYIQTSDYACCNESYDCVYDGLCYGSCIPGESSCSMADIDGDGIKGHYCMNDGSGKWRDCDQGQSLCTTVSYCGYTDAWAISGEQIDHGDYDANYGMESCCGDDVGEYLIEKNGNYICCNSSDDTLNDYYNCQSSNASN